MWIQGWMPGSRLQTEGSTSTPDLQQVLTILARDVVELQRALDDSARATFATWRERGVPPSAWTLSRLRADLRLGVRTSPIQAYGRQSQLQAQPKAGCRAVVKVGIRFIRPTATVENLADDSESNLQIKEAPDAAHRR